MIFTERPDVAAIGAVAANADGSLAAAGRAEAINLKTVQIKPVSDKPGDKSPDFRVFAGKGEVGKTAEKGWGDTPTACRSPGRAFRSTPPATRPWSSSTAITPWSGRAATVPGRTEAASPSRHPAGRARRAVAAWPTQAIPAR